MARQAKPRELEEKARAKGRKPRGRPPQPPQPGPRDQDQYNFTDPDSRIMKNSTDEGFDQHYNAQAAVDQASLLIVATSLSNHPNDKKEAEPTVDAISPRVGTPDAAALDNGYSSPGNVKALEDRGIDAYIATGREPHHLSWETFFAKQPAPPPAEASAREDGVQVADRHWSRNLSVAQDDRRTGDRTHQRSSGLPPILVARLGCGCRAMVSGLLGVQSQAVACFDGRLNAGGVSARPKAGKKPIVAQVVKEFRLYGIGENALSESSPTNC